MSKKHTYTPYIPDDLVSALAGDTDAALLACKLGTFADEKGAIFVSFSYIANLWNWKDERRVKKAANKLSVLQIWHYKKGDGRGHISEWVKGANYDTFVTLKRVQNLQIKGTKNAPINKDIINKGGGRARVSASSASKPSTLKKEVMEDFDKFWTGYKPAKDYEHERGACERLWSLMSPELRAEIITVCKRAKGNKNPYWWMRDYTPKRPENLRKGVRLTREEYYAKFGSDEVRAGWRFYKPDGYERFIFEKIA